MWDLFIINENFLLFYFGSRFKHLILIFIIDYFFKHLILKSSMNSRYRSIVHMYENEKNYK